MSVPRLLRVKVLEVWDEVALTWPSDTTIGAVKVAALAAFRVPDGPEAFMVKYRGAELRDESHTLAALDIPDDANLIVLRRARRAVR